MSAESNIVKHMLELDAHLSRVRQALAVLDDEAGLAIEPKEVADRAVSAIVELKRLRALRNGIPS